MQKTFHVTFFSGKKGRCEYKRTIVRIMDWCSVKRRILNSQEISMEAVIKKELYNIAKRCDIERIGVADLSPATEHLVRQGGKIFDRYPRAVSIGFDLANEVIASIADHGNRTLVMNYIHHVYSVVNHRLDQAALSIAMFLMHQGHRAFPVPASQVLSFETYTGLAPHKTAAHLAGLGWIGKSALLVTKDFGPRVRFATIYTDAPLTADTPRRSRCGACRICVDVCPANAFTGNSFDPERPREHIYDAAACNAYMKDRRLSLLGKSVFGGNCGLCIQVCPFGKPKRSGN